MRSVAEPDGGRPGLASIQVLERAAVAYPWLIGSQPTLIRALPAAARAKLETPGLDGSFAPCLEILSLVLRRLETCGESGSAAPMSRFSISNRSSAKTSGTAFASFTSKVSPQRLGRGAGHTRAALRTGSERRRPGLSPSDLRDRRPSQPIDNIARLQPAQAGRLIDPLADAVARAGYPRTANLRAKSGRCRGFGCEG